MTRTVNRHGLLDEIRDYLFTLREPISQAELGRRLKIEKSKLSRIIAQMELAYPGLLVIDGRRHIRIDRAKHTFVLSVTLDQACALFIATRLFARYADKPSPHARDALRQLGKALRGVAPRIADHVDTTSTRLNQPADEHSEQYTSMLRTLTWAWAEGYRVRLEKEDEPGVYRDFDTYFIEPSAVGYLTYAIGHDHRSGEIRTFTIDRLKSVTRLLTSYEIPIGFDADGLMGNAWYVNYGKGAMVEVVLRFRQGRASDRVRMTRWHASQTVTMLADGSCELRVKIGDPLEMKPWIRQWGADCEVIEPPDLRGAIARELRLAVERYGTS
jgi:predicted DNA-binding transcriptional regulator YafY